RFSASSSRGTSSAAEPKRTPRCAEGLRTRPSAFSHQGRGERGRGTGRGQARGRRRDASGASDGRCGLLEREGLFVEGSAEDGAVDLGVLRERAQIVERTDAARSENRQATSLRELHRGFDIGPHPRPIARDVRIEDRRYRQSRKLLNELDG